MRPTTSRIVCLLSPSLCLGRRGDYRVTGGLIASIDLTATPVDTAALRGMKDRAAHRASSEAALGAGDLVVHEPWCALASVGRSAIGVGSFEGRRFVCAIHGRIDNVDALVAEVQRPLDSSDVALVVGNLLAARRVGGFDLIQGDWTALWCGLDDRQLIAARSVGGMTPMAFRHIGSVLHIAPECSQLLLPGPSCEPDLAHLAEKLSGRARTRTSTPWTGISRVEPGTALVCDATRQHITRWWDPSRLIHRPDRHRVTEVNWDADLAAAVRSAITRRLGSTGTGVELSGGFDSSTVLAIAAESSSPVVALTRGHGPATVEDVATAQKVADHVGVEHWLTHPRGAAVDEAVAWQERRTAQTADLTVSSFVAWQWHADLARLAHRGFGVALTGQGGDERLGPAHRGIIDQMRRPRGAWTMAQSVLGDQYSTVGLARQMARFAFEAVRPPGWRRPGGSATPHTDQMAWLGRDLAVRVNLEDRIAPPARVAGVSHAKTQLLDWALTEDANGFTDVAERAAAAHGIAYLHPFDDQALVAWTLGVPEHLRVSPADNRAAHRRLVAPLLPPAVSQRVSKADFFGPIAESVRSAASIGGWGRASSARSSAVVEAGLIDGDWLESTLAALHSGISNAGPAIDEILVVEKLLTRAP